jgi:hypothetical protein
MNKPHAIGALVIVIGATFAGGSARADCTTTCLPLLCPSPTTTIVSGEITADPAAAAGVSLVVGSVLRLAPGATAPAPGTRLQAWSLARITSGPVVGYFNGVNLELPTALFAIEDGNVHCRGEAERTTAPKGMGVTPERLASLTAEECRPVLSAAGYTSPPCDDEGFGCTVGGPARAPAPWSLITAALVGLALAARLRSRNPGAGPVDPHPHHPGAQHVQAGGGGVRQI